MSVKRERTVNQRNGLKRQNAQIPFRLFGRLFFVLCRGVELYAVACWALPPNVMGLPWMSTTTRFVTPASSIACSDRSHTAPMRLAQCHRVLPPDVDTAHLDHVELRAGHVERRSIGRLAWGWNGAIAVLTLAWSSPRSHRSFGTGPCVVRSS